MLGVLQLLVLGAIALFCYKIWKVVEKALPLLERLYTPSKDEKLASMTLVEAQKEAIRIREMISEWIDVFAIKIANKIAESLNKGMKKGK